MKQKIEIEVDVPDGWELTGEYRRTTSTGEWVLGDNGVVCKLFDSLANYLIVRRVQRYREPVLPADAGKECEFYHLKPEAGLIKRLAGYNSNDSSCWIDDCGTCWQHARIEDTSQ